MMGVGASALGALSYWICNRQQSKAELPEDLDWEQVGAKVPYAIAVLYCQLVAQDAFSSEGIFRKSGDAGAISRCEKQVCSGATADDTSVSEHVLSNVIKRVIEQELSSPPLDAFADLLNDVDAAPTLHAMTDDEVSAMLVKRVHSARDRSIFTVVMDMIAQTVEHQVTNKMDIRNCVITMGPRMCSDALFLKTIMKPTILIALVSRLVRWRNSCSFRDYFGTNKRQQLIRFSGALAGAGHSIRTIGRLQTPKQLKDFLASMVAHGVTGGFAVQLRRTVEHCRAHTVLWPPAPPDLKKLTPENAARLQVKSAADSSASAAPTTPASAAAAASATTHTMAKANDAT